MNWYSGTIPEAVTEAKLHKKLMLVYIEGSDEESQSMSATYNDPSIAEKFSSDNTIGLKLTAGSVPFNQFSAIYPVSIIPSSFFIAGHGSPIEIVTGSHSPTEFLEKLNKVFEVYEKRCSKPKAETSSSSTSVNQSVTTQQQSEPSTSSQATAVSTEAPDISLQEKIDRANALIEAQKIVKAQEEQEKEKRAEIERRNMGKAMQQAEQTKRDNEMKEWAKNRAKDKEEEQLAKERVKAMIAQDRAEQAAKFQRTKEAEQAERERLARLKEETEKSLQNAAFSSNEARLQFRLPDGSFSTHTFSADAPLEEARNFIINEVRPPFRNFTLCTTFPRRHFTQSDHSLSLRDLQLAPSAVLLILPAQTVSALPGPNSGFLAQMFWLITSPIWSLWNYVTSMFSGRGQQPPTPPAQENTATEPQPSTSKAGQTSSDRQANLRRRGEQQKFAKREGNVFRINNQSEDDDDNGTYNGNSTQQM